MGQLYNEFSTVFQPDIGSNKTKELQEADKEGDIHYGGIIEAVGSFMKSGTAEEKQQATILNQIFSKYPRSISRLPLTENLEKIYAFISETRKEPYADAVDFLRLTSRVDELERLNNEFDRLYDLRSEENLSKAQEATLKDLKNQWIPAYRVIAERLSVRYASAVDNDETEVIAELGRLIDRVNATMLSLYRVLSHRKIKINKKTIALALGGATNPSDLEEFDDDEEAGGSEEGISL